MVERFDNSSVVKYARRGSCQIQVISSAYRNKLREFEGPYEQIRKERRWSNHMGKDQRVYTSQLGCKGNFLDHSLIHLLFTVV